MTTNPCPSCGGLGILTPSCRGLRATPLHLQRHLIGEICPTCKGEGHVPKPQPPTHDRDER